MSVNDKKADPAIDPGLAKQAPTPESTLSKAPPATIGAYNPDISRQALAQPAEPTLWVDSPAIRAGVMIGTRGVVGALAFTAMSTVMTKGLGGKTGYNPSDSWATNAKNPFKLMAKTVDWSAGRLIKGAVTKIAKWSGREAKTAERIGMNAVHFRPTWYRRTDYNGDVIWGQSLGAEAVRVTLPFAAMSFANKLAFDGIMALDPNAKHKWKDDKGHIKVGELAKSIGGTVVTGVIKSAGEDFAVALPYVYLTRGLRSVINRFSPGWKKDFDAGLFGASVKLDAKHDAVSTFAPEAMASLHGQFTGYNILTKWFRSGFDHVAARFAGRNDRFYGAPDRVESKGFLGETADIVKGAVRDGIKAVIFMFPTVPMFFMRAYQKKDQGFLINKEGATMVGKNPNRDGIRERIRANYLEGPDKLTGSFQNEMMYYSHHNPNSINEVPFEPQPIGLAKDVNPILKEGFNESRKGKTVIGHTVTNVQDKLSTTLDFLSKNGPSGNKQRDFTGKYIKDSLAYTPYFLMKDLATIYVDHARTDVGLEQAINGASSLDWRKFTAGMQATAYALMNKSLPDAALEKEAQRRIAIKSNHSQLTWQERTISKQSADKQEIMSKKDKQSLGYIKQQEMRDALKHLVPVSNLIH